MKLDFEIDSVKMLRETLCLAQGFINTEAPLDRVLEHSTRIQILINECDRHHPLNSDGIHGGLHTLTCGCEDKVKPHSRACGTRNHPHGSQCHANCPTCEGKGW